MIAYYQTKNFKQIKILKKYKKMKIYKKNKKQNIVSVIKIKIYLY